MYSNSLANFPFASFLQYQNTGCWVGMDISNANQVQYRRVPFVIMDQFHAAISGSRLMPRLSSSVVYMTPSITETCMGLQIVTLLLK